MANSIGSKGTVRIVAGGAHDAVTVRHLAVQGSQRVIGRALAKAALEVHGPAAQPREAVDPMVERVRRRWFATHYPSHAQRLAGVADHLQIDPDDDRWVLDWLGTYQVPAGCSVAFVPGAEMKDHCAVLARNFDFPTATFSQITGGQPLPQERPLAADPWVLATYPDTGYASVIVGIMDVMGGMDGVNEMGLAVALLADNESAEPEPVSTPQVGLAEQQVVRYLLETCATAQEAKEALLLAKHYYFFTPCHFLVADRAGSSFVWEHSPRRNREVIVEPRPGSSGGRLVCTNHLLHRWPDARALPDDSGPVGTAAFTYRRWRHLSAGLDGGGLVDRDELRDRFAEVAFVAPLREARTYWHAQYDLTEASAEITFFVRDEDGVSRYGEPLRFPLGT